MYSHRTAYITSGIGEGQYLSGLFQVGICLIANIAIIGLPDTFVPTVGTVLP